MKSNIFYLTDYGVNNDGYSDSTSAINKVFEEIATSGGGTVVFPSGNIRISSPLIIPDSGIRIQTASSYLTKITPLDNFSGEAILFFKKASNRSGNKGINLDHGININCNNKQTNGIIIENGYDQITFRNVEVRNVHSDFSGFLFKKTEENPTVEVGQTILLENCIVDHTTNMPIAPCYSFTKYQEINLIGCKGFANPPLSEPALPGSIRQGVAFDFKDCRGVTLTGCSAGFAHTAISFTAETRSVVGLTIIGQTNEAITGDALYTEAKGAYFVDQVMVLPIRRQVGKNDITEGSGKYNLNQTGQSELHTGIEKVILGKGCNQNIIFTSNKENVSGNMKNSTIIAGANNNKLGTTFNESIEILTSSISDAPILNFVNQDGASSRILYTRYGALEAQKYNPETKTWNPTLRVVEGSANNYTGLYVPYRVDGILKFAPIRVGAPESGGAGLRALALPN
ncbi:hypothetical protein X560_0951 [Listeria fleischmannii 1991]|uniref:Pectate lyase superfamily protein n=2 Tax=Listeria fleischmannii TaxID=1069827 RepID=A0A2X3J6J0_9LIST|nr:glycosyl hydrolase family 28-related protein [Listeria fleischmannii]EMG27177.1 hypothetical protein LFLEISCH_12523 [Listeria fleischmannii subsp. fleischmannii LU2006-1]KMT60025.1 hypothetical protein X560_0951 [Listeria fleischmannii 1991]SQC68659.1 Pectate lyase superfamily protein [Listeria fleischmannii subsp. fleischmannii]